jgi:metal-dependent amidase/aminoacylase/carboxypeptidase family protein
MASANNFAIKIRGKSGRAALPHTGIDPVPVACEMVQAFQTILTRSKKPSEVAVISVTHDPCGEGQ